MKNANLFWIESWKVGQSMPNDVVLNKVQIIERCMKRIHEEYNANPLNLKNYTKQDSIILNIQRACEACIDLAMHIVAEKKLGIPQSSREAFDMLVVAQLLDENLSFPVIIKDLPQWFQCPVPQVESLSDLTIKKKTQQNYSGPPFYIQVLHIVL
jgi:hypothetical protein